MTAVLDQVLKLTADQILSIQADNPEALFPPVLDDVKTAYRGLSKKWFPDRNKDPRAKEVQIRLNALYDAAQDRLARDAWREKGVFTATLTNGKKFRVGADVSRTFELGTMHICPTTVTYVVDRAYADLFKNALTVFGRLTFADDKMKKIYAPRLPTVTKTYETADSFILTIRKNPEDVVLRDLKPKIPKAELSKHTAWILSRLHEQVRYLDYIGVAHNAITLDTVFVSARDHTASLLGGWWYAAPFNGKLAAVPAASEEFISEDAFDTGKPDPKTDLEMIRACGRELLGDRRGTRLSMMKAAPQKMIDYLRLPTSGKAQKDLTHWYQDVLPKSFGARRFTELKVTYSDIYKPQGAQP